MAKALSRDVSRGGALDASQITEPPERSEEERSQEERPEQERPLASPMAPDLTPAVTPAHAPAEAGLSPGASAEPGLAAISEAPPRAAQ